MIKKIKKVDYQEKIQLSYDPDDVNIRLQHFRVSDLITMIQDKKSLDILDEDFKLMGESEDIIDIEFENLDILTEDDVQRQPDLWNEVQKSLFIESLMIRLPIPLFYFDGSEKTWRVIDGLQRLHTILNFINGEFRLRSLEYLKDCEGKYFFDIDFPGYLKARILDAEIVAYVINPGTPPDVKYNIFKRINTGGLKLNGQEIRNAFFRGEPARFVKTLSKESIFRDATNNRATQRRMLDREYVNRFIAFQIFDYNDYNGKMDRFLSDAMMDLYKRTNDELEELHQLFLFAMKRSIDLFGKYTFYRPKDDGQWGRLPNKALFDTMSWNLAELNDQKFYEICNNINRFKKEYFIFMNTDSTMFKSINDTTSAKSAVINRFTLLKDFLNNF